MNNNTIIKESISMIKSANEVFVSVNGTSDGFSIRVSKTNAAILIREAGGQLVAIDYDDDDVLIVTNYDFD